MVFSVSSADGRRENFGSKPACEAFDSLLDSLHRKFNTSGEFIVALGGGSVDLPVVFRRIESSPHEQRGADICEAFPRISPASIFVLMVE